MVTGSRSVILDAAVNSAKAITASATAKTINI